LVIVCKWTSSVSANAFGEENSRRLSNVVTKSAAALPGLSADDRRLAA